MTDKKINILFTGISGSDLALHLLVNSDKVNFIHFNSLNREAKVIMK